MCVCVSTIYDFYHDLKESCLHKFITTCGGVRSKKDGWGWFSAKTSLEVNKYWTVEWAYLYNMVDGVLILPASLEESVFRGFINTPVSQSLMHLYNPVVFFIGAQL